MNISNRPSVIQLSSAKQTLLALGRRKEEVLAKKSDIIQRLSEIKRDCIQTLSGPAYAIKMTERQKLVSQMQDVERELNAIKGEIREAAMLDNQDYMSPQNRPVIQSLVRLRDGYEQMSEDETRTTTTRRMARDFAKELSDIIHDSITS